MDFDSLQDDSMAKAQPAQVTASATPQSFDSLQDDSEKYGSAGQQVIAGLEGAAQGLAGPLAPAAEEALGVDPKGIRLRAEQNPWTHGLSEAAGFVGGALTGTGEAALVGKAGEAAAGALKLGGEGAGIASKLGGAATKMATEMALIQAGDEGTKAITQDPNQTVGSVVSNVGLSALLGGIGGGVLKGSGMLLGAAADKVGAKQFIEDFKSRMETNMSGVNSEENVVKELTDHHANITDLADEVYGPKGLKAQEIEKLMPEMRPEMGQQAEDLSKKVQGAIEELGDDPLARKLQDSLNEFHAKISPEIDPLTLRAKSEVTPSEIFNAAQEFKQKLQEWSKFSKIAPPPISDRDFVRSAATLSHDFRTALEDSNVWGKVADRQNSINKAFSEYLPTLKDFQSKFMTKIEGVPEIDPAKVRTFLNQNGKATSETVRQKMLGNFLDKSEAYQRAIEETHANLGIESPLQHSSLAATTDALKKLSPGAKAADLYYQKAMSKALGQGIGGAVGAVLGHPVGLGEAGAWVGSKIGGSLLPSFLQPLMEKTASLKGFQDAITFGANVLKGEKKLFDVADNVFVTEGKTLPQHFMPDSEDIEKLDHRLKLVAENPGGMTEVAGNLGHYMPNHAQAVAQGAAGAVGYLNAQRPMPQRNSPLDTEIKPSKIQEAEFKRTLTIAQQPLAILKYMKDGTLSPKDLSTLKTLYPAYYDKMAARLTASMTDHLSKDGKIPYSLRQPLSLFLGQAMDSTFKPESIMAIQNTFSQPGSSEQQQAQGGGAPGNIKRGTAKLGQAASSLRTNDQARAVRANKV